MARLPSLLPCEDATTLRIGFAAAGDPAQREALTRTVAEGRALREAGKLAESEAVLSPLVERLRKDRVDPVAGAAHRELGLVNDRRGRRGVDSPRLRVTGAIHYRPGSYAAAERDQTAGLALDARLHGAASLAAARLLTDLANTVVELGKPEEAIGHFQRSSERCRCSKSPRTTTRRSLPGRSYCSSGPTRRSGLSNRRARLGLTSEAA
jgi:hypothetical protein